jgi:hypothetical protein
MADSRIFFDEIPVKGHIVKVPALKFGDYTVIVSGRILKIAAIKDESCQKMNVTEPEEIIRKLRDSGVGADVFTFTQNVMSTQPQFDYYYEWDNFAAIPISSYDEWIKKQICKNARNKLHKAEKIGVTARLALYDDVFVNGIVSIYNESQIRQGRRFWHYGKSFDTVKNENSTYGDCSDFIGAYYRDEMIGYAKIVYLGDYARTMQIISKQSHRDKSPTNTLIAKAVELCAEKGMKYLLYGKFVYNEKGIDSLTLFKMGNGFVKIEVPKYFVPLTLKGKLGIRTGFHHFPRNVIPKRIVNTLRKFRNLANRKKTPH